MSTMLPLRVETMFEASTPLEARYLLLARAQQSPALQTLLLEQCRRSLLFWLNTFCWTFDPRQPEADRPFALFDYQIELAQQLAQAIETGHDVLIEKSRDMGVSWLVLLVFQYYWLFRPGSQFLIGSRKEDYVDRKGDLASLIEKLRYNLSWLPAWMLPKGFDASKHQPSMRLINPHNGNLIAGESSNEHFARGGRFKAILQDEFPFWPNAEAAFASAGQSSPCRIVVGTPYGKHNKFADLRFNSPIQTLTVHWREHPQKTDAWYQAQKARMTQAEIARELDINYNLSLDNRVFEGFTPEHQRDLQHNPERRIIRSWDFGYHCPACLFIQIDVWDRILVLQEVVGERVLLVDFAKRVQQISQNDYPNVLFEDWCDPAGSQRSDKSDRTSIEILNGLGIYPSFERSPILKGIELIRMKLAERLRQPDVSETPMMLVDKRCEHLITAFEGGYRYGRLYDELPMQEHPYEDVMDCLRYAVVAKASLFSLPPVKPVRPYRPMNRYTGY